MLELSVCLFQRLAPWLVIVVVVIVSIAGDYISGRIVTVPSVRMASVPVIAPVGVVGPVTAEAYEDKSAVVIGPECSECIVRAPRVADGPAAIRPGDPVENSARRVMVAMVMVKAPAGVRVIAVAVVPSVDTAGAESRTRRRW